MSPLTPEVPPPVAPAEAPAAPSEERESALRRIVRGIGRKRTRHVLVAAGLLIADLEPVSFLAGAAIILFAATLRVFSKGFLMQRVKLTTGGLYRWTRHPFYFANAVLDLGLLLIIHQPWLIAPYFLFWAVFHYEKMIREERLLEEKFGEDYRLYKMRVPRLIPVPWKFWRETDRQEFSWRNPNIRERLEIPRFLVALSYPVLLFAAHGVRTGGLEFVGASHAGLNAAAALVFLYGFAWFLIRPLRRRKPIMPAAAGHPITRAAVLMLTLGFLFACRAIAIPPGPDLRHAAEAVAGALLVTSILLAIRRGGPATIVFEGAAAIAASLAAGMPWIGFVAATWFACVFADRVLFDDPPAPAPRLLPLGMLVLAASLTIVRTYADAGGWLALP